MSAIAVCGSLGGEFVSGLISMVVMRLFGAVLWSVGWWSEGLGDLLMV